MGLTGLLNETLSSLTGRMAGPRFSVIEPAGKGAVVNVMASLAQASR